MTTLRTRVVRFPRLLKVVTDGLLSMLATVLAFEITSQGRALDGSLTRTLIGATVVLFALKMVGYVLLRIPQRSWSTVTFRDLAALGVVIASSTVVGTALHPLLFDHAGLAVTLPLLDGFVSMFLLSGVRGFARYRYERIVGASVASSPQKRVLVAGAGRMGTSVVSELLRHPETGMVPVGLLDDSYRQNGRRVAGVRVLGRLSDAATVITDEHIDEVLIALPSNRRATIRKMIDQVEQVDPGIPCKIIPGMYEVLSGKVDISRIRDVGIDDLLGRAAVHLDVEAILGYLDGKRVLVTGAGGSIGSELVRQICRFNPAELILFGHGENSIYSLQQELKRDWPDIKHQGVIGAIQNRDRLDNVFLRYRPQVVFHAAAHKHVPLMEANPEEAVFNNIVGSRNLVDMAVKHHVSHFVAISTDKAINPTSVMGASKRMVEHLVKDGARRAAPDQVFVAVRFGNVLGSRGSVIPTFKNQIRAGGPITITHPDMVRYFMTIPEAAQLVLQASGMGKNNEVFILDMGEPVRIVDLARDLIRLSGLEPGVDIKFRFTGLRPGERLSETLLTDKEKTIATTHEKIVIAETEGAEPGPLYDAIDRLQDAAMVSDHARIRAILQEFLEGCKLESEPVLPEALTRAEEAPRPSATLAN